MIPKHNTPALLQLRQLAYGPLESHPDRTFAQSQFASAADSRQDIDAVCIQMLPELPHPAESVPETTVKRSYLLLYLTVMTFVPSASAQEWKSGVEWQEPPVVTPGKRNHHAPSDAIILFDGTNLEEWENGELWKIEDGNAIPEQTNIYSKRHFGDIQLHVEWAAPKEIESKGQGRGNSGIFLMDRYEVQVLDSYKNETYFDGQAAGIYKQTPPMVNAMRRPGEWNTYDIFFTAPKFRTNGDLETPAYVTVMHNGVLVQNHFEILGPTNYIAAPHYEAHAEAAPIRIQFHGNPVRFRNIWVRELKPAIGRRVSAPFNKPVKIEIRSVPEDNESDDEDEDEADEDHEDAEEPESEEEQDEADPGTEDAE